MRTSFLADVDGFAFVNRWSFDEVERDRARQVLLAATPLALTALAPLCGPLFPIAGLAPLLGRELIDRLDAPVGFCGGMVAAANDYFARGTLTPRGHHELDHPDRRSSAAGALRDFVLRRLWDGLALDASRFLEWMALLHLLPERAGGGPAALLRRTHTELEEVTALLDHAHLPVPLGVIGTTRSPFVNHTVLALGYTRSGAHRVELVVYDPNVPGEESVLRLDLSDSAGLTADEGRSTHAERGPLRGLLRQRYPAAVPPPALEGRLDAGLTEVRRGQTVPLRAWVVNRGYAPTPPLVIQVEGTLHAGVPAGHIGVELQSAPLEPGASRVLEWTATPPERGVWTYRVGVQIPRSAGGVVRYPLLAGTERPPEHRVRVSD